jgi:hypothetical protein
MIFDRIDPTALAGTATRIRIASIDAAAGDRF